MYAVVAAAKLMQDLVIFRGRGRCSSRQQENSQRSICLPQQQGWHPGVLQAAAAASECPAAAWVAAVACLACCQPAGLPAALCAALAALQARHRRSQLKSGTCLGHICRPQRKR